MSRPPTKRQLPAPVAALLAPLFLVLTVVSAWWLVGDLSTSVLPPEQLDRVVAPPSVPPAVEIWCGVGATVAVVAGLALAAAAVRAGRLAGPWLTLMVVLVACGLVAGWSGRVVTAGGIGANIGAGFVVLIVAPALGLVLLLALTRALLLARGVPGSGPSPNAPDPGGE